MTIHLTQKKNKVFSGVDEDSFNLEQTIFYFIDIR